MMLVAEGMHLRTGDPVWRALARRWSKVFAVLFAVGAVSGTIISFELGLLWPRFMAYAGGIIGLPFSLEGAAFFIEAIFVGIYLYGWDRLSPRAALAVRCPDRALRRRLGVLHRHRQRLDERPARLSAASTATSRTSIRWRRCSTPRGRPRPRTWCSAPTWRPRSAWPRSTRSGCCAGAATPITARRSPLALSTAAILAPLQVGVGDLLGRTVAAQPAGEARRDRGRDPHRARRRSERRRLPGPGPRRRVLNVKVPHLLSVLAFDRAERDCARAGHRSPRPTARRWRARCGSPSSAWSGSAPGLVALSALVLAAPAPRTHRARGPPHAARGRRARARWRSSPTSSAGW